MNNEAQRMLERAVAEQMSIANPSQLQNEIEKFEQVAASRLNELSSKFGIESFWLATAEQRSSIGITFMPRIYDVSEAMDGKRPEEVAALSGAFEILQERADQMRSAGIKFIFIIDKERGND